MRKKTLELAELIEANKAGAGDVEIADELRLLHDQLGKATAMARIRQQRITQLETAVKNLHKVRGRYNTQIAAADLFALCGLSAERTTK